MLYIVLIANLGIFIGSMFAFLKGLIPFLLRKKTKGVIVSITPTKTSNKTTKWIYNILFTLYENKQEVTGIKFSSFPLFGKIGESVNVYYKKDKPNDFKCYFLEIKWLEYIFWFCLIPFSIFGAYESLLLIKTKSEFSLVDSRIVFIMFTLVTLASCYLTLISVKKKNSN